MNKTEIETLPELEQKMNLAKRHLFLLFDFATLSPQEIRLNSSTFTWSTHIFEVVQESKQMIDGKMRQFQDSLRLRRERLIEDLESFAQQVNDTAILDQVPVCYCRYVQETASHQCAPTGFFSRVD